MISLETAQELIERSRHRPAWSSPHTMLLLLIGATLGALLANPKWLTENSVLQIVVPQILLIIVAVWIWARARRQRRTAAMMESVWEAVQLKEWGRAESQAVEVLRRPVRPTHARAQSLMALAAVADHQKHYTVSQRILESILDEPGIDRGTFYAARIALAGTLLRTEQLADAIRMVERLVRDDVPDPVRAQIELLSLFRFVTMGQVEDAVDRADERRELFRRHLGIRAGYGYALLASAFDRAGQPDRAARLWQDATLLLAPADLVDRFPEVAPAAKKYAATEWPV